MELQLNVLNATSNSGKLKREDATKSQVPKVETSTDEASNSNKSEPKQVEGMSVRESFNFLRERAQFSVDQTSGKLEIIPASRVDLERHDVGQIPASYMQSAGNSCGEERLGALLNRSV